MTKNFLKKKIATFCYEISRRDIYVHVPPKTALLCLVLKDVNKNMIYDYSGISCVFGGFSPPKLTCKKKKQYKRVIGNIFRLERNN